MSQLKPEDFKKLADPALAAAQGLHQSAINAVAARRGFAPAEWMDWHAPGGTVLLAELAKDDGGVAYEAFVKFAMSSVWPTADRKSRAHLLTCLVEALHILNFKKNSTNDPSWKKTFDRRSIDTVKAYIEVRSNHRVETGLRVMSAALKGKFPEVMKAAKHEDEARREALALGRAVKG